MLWVFLFPRKILRILDAQKLCKSVCVFHGFWQDLESDWTNGWTKLHHRAYVCFGGHSWTFGGHVTKKSHCFTRNGGPERYIQHYKNTPFMDHSSWSRQFWQKPKQFYLCSFSRTSDKIGLVDQRWPVCFGRFWRNRGALKFVMKVSQTSGTWWPVDPHIVNGKLYGDVMLIHYFQREILGTLGRVPQQLFPKYYTILPYTTIILSIYRWYICWYIHRVLSQGYPTFPFDIFWYLIPYLSFLLVGLRYTSVWSKLGSKTGSQRCELDVISYPPGN